MTATTEHMSAVTKTFSDCLIIANPAASGVTAQVVSQIEARLEGSAVIADDARVRTVWTRAPGHAGQLATSHPEADLIIAVGGDGTVGEAAQALSALGRSSQVLCVLPVGSGNSTARSLWGDRAWHEVLDLMCGPSVDDQIAVRRIDLMRLHEPAVTSILGTSTGFLAQVLIGANHVDPKLTGIDRYYAAAVEVLQDMPSHPTRVTVDGVVLHDGQTCSVAVGGGRFRARSFQFLPESVLDDGLLDVSTIGALDAAAVADLAPLMPMGQHIGRPEVTYGRGHNVVVERTDGQPLVAEFDGTVWAGAGARLTIDVLPAALAAMAASDAIAG